ncbi:hypothetical protein [Sphingomonas jinjuensis]|uniref:hypothetical protein n=1 Tax=Sphingomonas jinjuensis TaxID=535907 RepID=UPI00161DB816|nr:hypothetical protein [Sphingomonas jinjuensis]
MIYPITELSDPVLGATVTVAITIIRRASSSRHVYAPSFDPVGKSTWMRCRAPLQSRRDIGGKAG